MFATGVGEPAGEILCEIIVLKALLLILLLGIGELELCTAGPDDEPDVPDEDCNKL